ncbi:P-II family nitrogen regulator [Liberiplasma polymorphum]|uniref:P-II family nitrogen regulator n=1 Tax=Liberiplasma polymorphum TaxID=3374570 RepID=UPI0037765290
MSKYQCIITVTKRGLGSDVVDASRRNGAQGGTILHGRGTSDAEIKKIFGMFIEPEKELVITVVEATKTKKVTEGIRNAVELDKPGRGILFVVDLDDVVGISKITDKEE